MRRNFGLLVFALCVLLGNTLAAAPADEARAALASRSSWSHIVEKTGGFNFSCPADWRYKGAVEMFGRTCYKLDPPSSLFTSKEGEVGSGSMVVFIHPAREPFEAYIARQQNLLLEGKDDGRLEWKAYPKSAGSIKVFEWGVSYTLDPLTPRWLDIQRIFYLSDRQFLLSFGLPASCGQEVRSLAQAVMDTVASPHSIYDSLKL